MLCGFGAVIKSLFHVVLAMGPSKGSSVFLLISLELDLKELFLTDSDLLEPFCHGAVSVSRSETRLLGCYVYRVNSPATKQRFI